MVTLLTLPLQHFNYGTCKGARRAWRQQLPGPSTFLKDWRFSLRISYMAQSLLTIRNWEDLARLANYNCVELARLAGTTPRNLQRFFKRRFGTSPQAWINAHRLTKAKQLILQGRGTKELSHLLGYKQVSHFCRQFRKVHGISPRVVRPKERFDQPL